MKDTIYREAAIDALWKALYEYEEKTEKQFRESDDLDVADWIQHRIFVQNMSDIDRQVIMELPSAQPERTVYANMSDEQFERWLYEHGICHPDIHKPIQCSEVPLLIDAAINELPSAASEAHVIKLRMDIDKNEFLKAFEAAKKNLPTVLPRETTGWIPVAERLPEEYTRVIGYMAWKAMTTIEYQHGRWYSIDHLEPLPDEAVSHWMPLPQPPKEGEDEN